MRISVTFRHLDSSEALKDYAAQKLSKVNKYFDGPINANVVLGVEKFRQIAEITVSSGKFTVSCKEETNDMYQSIDRVLDKLERKVKRQRDKLRRKPQSDQDKYRYQKMVDEEEFK